MSFRSPDRALIVALALLAIRFARDRVTGLLGIPWLGWRAALARRLDVSREPLQSPVRPGVWRRLALTTLALLAMAAILMYPQWRQPYAVPDLGDPLFNVWLAAAPRVSSECARDRVRSRLLPVPDDDYAFVMILGYRDADDAVASFLGREIRRLLTEVIPRRERALEDLESNAHPGLLGGM